jgi:hypothetical protein
MEKRLDIPGSELVTEIFGYWPSFHDATVVRMSLETTNTYVVGPNLCADIYAFEMANESNLDGSMVLRHNVLISFCFAGVDDLHLDGFWNQNTLLQLAITDIRSRQLEWLKFEVFIDGYGISTKFLCHAVSVQGVREWQPEDKN